MVDNGGVTRRSFIQTMGLSAAGAAIETSVAAIQADADAPPIVGPGPIAVTLRVNGQDLNHSIDPGTTLMEYLRWHTGLTGTKEVCDRGACGACSVLVDGTLVNSCMMLALDAEGTEITPEWVRQMSVYFIKCFQHAGQVCLVADLILLNINAFSF